MRDVVAGGDKVLGEVERDINSICHLDAKSQSIIDRAASHLELVGSQARTALFSEAAEMLAVRESMDLTKARNSIRGSLQDLKEIVAQFRSPAEAVEPLWDIIAD